MGAMEWKLAPLILAVNSGADILPIGVLCSILALGNPEGERYAARLLEVLDRQ
jgi:hypothetical protein